MEILRILVVDDDPVMRRLIEQRLKSESYQVMVAEDGHKAKALLESATFDVVLTDLVMPGGIGGIEVLELTKDRYPKTEVVLITAHSSVESAVEAMKKGAADYLEKPINFDELLIKLDKISNLKTILRNARDIGQAMQVTEQEASVTIGALEILAARQKLTLDQLEELLDDESESEDSRISKALQILYQA